MIPINVTFSYCDGLLQMNLDRARVIGTQYDNEAIVLNFTRPDVFLDYDLVLYARDANGNLYSKNLFNANTYELPNTFTQTQHITMQVAFRKGSDYRESANAEMVMLRDGLTGGELPEPIPDLVAVPVGFYIYKGDLYLSYPDGSQPPDMYIDAGGNLIYNTGGTGGG